MLDPTGSACQTRASPSFCSGLKEAAFEREESRKRLAHLRGSYELYAFTISHQLALDLPDWVPDEVQGNWRAATRREFRGRLS